MAEPSTVNGGHLPRRSINCRVLPPPPELQKWVQENVAAIMFEFCGENASLEIDPGTGKVCFCPGPEISPPDIQKSLGATTFCNTTFTEIIQNYITYANTKGQTIPIQIKEDLKQAYRMLRDAIQK